MARGPSGDARPYGGREAAQADPRRATGPAGASPTGEGWTRHLVPESRGDDRDEGLLRLLALPLLVQVPAYGLLLYAALP